MTQAPCARGAMRTLAKGAYSVTHKRCLRHLAWRVTSGAIEEVLSGVAELEDLGVLGRDSVGEPDDCAESERTVCCSSLDRRVRGLPRGSRESALLALPCPSAK